MKYLPPSLHYYLVIIGMILFVGCNSQTRFTLRDAASNLPTDATATVLDTDGNQIPDAIDIDDDGLPDEPVDEPEIPEDPEIPEIPDDPDDPEPPIRDPETGECDIPASTRIIKTTKNMTIDGSDLNGNTSLWIHLSSHSKSVTIDLGSHEVERIIVKHSGNSNSVTIQDTIVTEAFCVEGLTGNSNREVIAENASVALVDARIRGRGNSIDVLTQPDEGLVSDIAGRGHCVSVPLGTTILENVMHNDNGHELLEDGTTCQ